MIKGGQLTRPYAVDQRTEGEGIQLRPQRRILAGHVEKRFRRKVDGIALKVALVLRRIVLEKTAV